MFKNLRTHLINFRQLVRIMGWLLMIEAGFMLFPTFTCLAYGESAGCHLPALPCSPGA